MTLEGKIGQERTFMIRSCIRQGCQNAFEYLDQGQVYSLERRPSGITEFFWLCGDCQPKFAVALSPEGEVEVVPREARRRRLLPNARADLRPFPAHTSRRVAA